MEKYASLRTHGMTGTRPYKIWQKMKERCYKPYNVSYKNYGARGIKMCDRWMDFANFWADMKDTYGDDLTIDRIDSNGNYEPSNCRWATWTEQNNNSSKNRLLTFQGKTMNVTQWAKELGVGASTLFSRLDYLGWDTEKALQTPPAVVDRHQKFRGSKNRIRIDGNTTTH